MDADLGLLLSGRAAAARESQGIPDKYVAFGHTNSKVLCWIYESGEVIHISSLALLKVSRQYIIKLSTDLFTSSQMLKHGRAGVPMEVMGLMLGEFVDEYTVQVIDVFAMPQSGTTVTVESVDHVFQAKMVDMLKQTGRWALQFSPDIDFVHHFLLANSIPIFDFISFLRIGQKWLWAGTTHIPASDVGCQVWISTRNRYGIVIIFAHASKRRQT